VQTLQPIHLAGNARAEFVRSWLLAQPAWRQYLTTCRATFAQ